MKRRSEKMSLRTRIAAAIIAAALVVGAAGPIASAPDAGDSSENVAAWSVRIGGVQLLGGSWS